MNSQKIHGDTKGVRVIAATPVSDHGALDLASIETVIDFYLLSGSDGLTILGTGRRCGRPPRTFLTCTCR